MTITFPLKPRTYRWSSGYRTPQRPDHRGVDLAAKEGTPLLACVSGRITVPPAEPGGAGRNIWITTDLDVDTGRVVVWKYFHMDEIHVHTGQYVIAGEVVGTVGWTGHVDPPNPNGAHTHVEKHDGNPSNPVDPTEDLRNAELALLGPPMPQYPPPPQSGTVTGPPAPHPGEDEMTPADWERLEDRLEEFKNEILGGVLATEVNGAKIVHAELDELARSLGRDPLPEFTVNVDAADDDEPAPV